mgnify:CR=1 FL=1
MAHSSQTREHKIAGSQDDLLSNRWIRIGLKAHDRKLVFSNLHTHINVESLEEAFKAIDGSKALGVDGVSKSVYGVNLDKNLHNLARRVQTGTYRPKPKREVEIQKQMVKLDLLRL